MPPTAPSAGSDDSAALLQRCGAGDRRAFRSLYEMWGGRLHGIALRITRQASLAADATHDAFVQVWQQAHRFDPARGSAEAFLISLVRYRALDIVRRHAREVPGYEPEDIEDETPDALARLVGSAEGAALQRCMSLLEADRQRLLVLAFVDGLSHGDYAAPGIRIVRRPVLREAGACAECRDSFPAANIVKERSYMLSPRRWRPP